MRRSVLFTVFLIIAGCSDPETERLVPGSRCEIVPWAKTTKKSVRYADFYDQSGPLTKLPTQTRVVVVAEKVRRRRIENSTERVLIKILTGPLEGHVGFVFRPHLRKNSAPIAKQEQPSKTQEIPPPLETEEATPASAESR